MMVFRTMVCLLVTFVIIPMVLCSQTGQDEKLITIRLIGAGEDARIKRSTTSSNLPEKLVFDIPTHEGEARLSLTRRSLLRTFDEDGEVPHTVMDDGVYVDDSKESAMIVKRDANEYKLKGIFVHREQHWELGPIEEEIEGSTATHKIFPMKTGEDGQTVSLVKDEVYAAGRDPSGTGSSDNFENVLQDGEERAQVNHVVEIAFVLDDLEVTRWKTLFGDTNYRTALRTWYSFIAESINMRYQTLKNYDFTINTRVTHLRLLNHSDSSFVNDNYNVLTNRVDDVATLYAFKDWVNNTNNQYGEKPLPQSDHYMLFSGYAFKGSLGVAFVGRLCSSDGVSIISASTSGIIGYVAAHELGHSLSARHDGQHETCWDSERYVMATSYSSPRKGLVSNYWTFSPCSINSFRRFLNSVNCTLPRNTEDHEVLSPLPRVPESRGRVVPSPSQQCNLYYGTKSSSQCIRLQSRSQFMLGKDSICQALYCFVPNTAGWCRAVQVQEYTSCGPKKWCVQGFCVDNKNVGPPVEKQQREPKTPLECTGILIEHANLKMYKDCLNKYWLNQESANPAGVNPILTN